ncbi:cobalamin B12-binding domain-containing protein, partial [Frankia sp. Cr1]|uniref:cobalamin B12-binding domain-containing protein n=1 Tax=Frankia sp. Cr1 TaxID=3073931 RepID=UPI002AD38EEC
MRVALLYPEVYDMARFRERRREFPPFGALYLAAAVENAGHDVTVIQVRPDQVGLDLVGFDAVGFSLASSATYGFMQEARERSRMDPGTLVMVGGVHANFYPTESLLDFRADVVCEGESEEAILEVLDRAAAGSGSFAGVAGARWVEGGQIRA